MWSSTDTRTSASGFISPIVRPRDRPSQPRGVRAAPAPTQAAPMDLGLADAAVVVTGGSKGMGRAAALTFAGEGARVAVLARGRTALDATVGALDAAGSADAIGIAADLTDRGQ